ncbi:ABC transporter permease [Actinotignum urinale]|uniref:ABC transporter permease n=1 Tax=Actinotignum urinale TaxID=190146 RepID=UPI0003B60C30|nr:iron ABC transporter permease [Actinotignum urinale]MDY5160638.1 iron ABC transporter permease [Actinotignum urinale]
MDKFGVGGGAGVADNLAAPPEKSVTKSPGRNTSAGFMRSAMLWGKLVRWLVGLIPCAFLAVFFIWPVVAMLVRGVLPGNAGFASAGLADSAIGVLTSSRTAHILWQTLWMAFAGSVASVLLGLPVAYSLYRIRFRGQRFVRALAIVPFVLPTVVVGSAFKTLLREGGPYAFLGWDDSALAVVAAMVFYNISVVVRTVGPHWASLPHHEEVAATLGARPGRVFWTVTLPALRPSITAAASLIFLFCSTAFGIVQTLGRPGYGTLETEIWIQTTTFLDLRTAAILSLLQILIVMATVWWSAKNRHASASGQLRGLRPKRITRGSYPAIAFMAVLMIAVITVPIVTLILSSLKVGGQWSFANYRHFLGGGQTHGFGGGPDVGGALANSVTMAGLATVVALVLGVLTAFAVARPLPRNSGKNRQVLRRFLSLLENMSLLPLGISAVTVGFGLFVTIRPLIEDAWILIPIVQGILALPLVVRTLTPILRAIPPRLREAAQTLRASPARVLLTVDIPQCRRAFAAAAGFACAMSLGEFGATSFLASGDTVTLPVVIAQLLGKPGAENYGAALAGAVLLGGLTALLMGACELISQPRPARSVPHSTPSENEVPHA